MRHGRRRAPGRRLPVRRRRRRGRGRIVPPAVVERGVHDRRGRARRQPRRARRGRRRSARARPSSARSCSTARQIGAGCVLRDCIVAAGVRIGDGHDDRRRRRARRGRHGRGGQRPRPRGASLPGDAICRDGRSRSEDCEQDERRHMTSATLPSACSTARPSPGRPDRPARPTSSRSRSTCATRCGRSSRRALDRWDTPGGLVVAGMGGSAIGGALARAALGDHASRPILGSRAYGLPPWTTPDTTVLCASYSGDTEETLACYEAAGALGAKRVVVTSGGKLAEHGPRRRRARDPGRRRLPAARGRRLHDRRRARGRRAVRRRAAHELRDRRRRRPPRGARRRVGAGGRRRRPGQVARARAARHDRR